MGIISRPHNSANTNYNQLKGSGILPTPNPICKLPKCKPKPLAVPRSPTPRPHKKFPLQPLVAKKLSKKDNRWQLGNTIYPNFNTLWVNIPYKNFTILKTPNG
jgi:hypothetical protein